MFRSVRAVASGSEEPGVGSTTSVGVALGSSETAVAAGVSVGGIGVPTTLKKVWAV